MDASGSSVQKGFHPESDVSHPKVQDRTGTGTIACYHTYNAWYAACRSCCSNAALVGRMFSIVREPCANNYFHTPLAEHLLLYMTKMNLTIFYRVSELRSTDCIDRSRKVSVTDGQEHRANHADVFQQPRKLLAAYKDLIWNTSCSHDNTRKS